MTNHETPYNLNIVLPSTFEPITALFIITVCDLQADHVIMDLENKPTETIDLWQEDTDRLEAVWNCLLAIPVVCMQPISVSARYSKHL